MSPYDALLASSAAPEWLSVLEAPDDLCGAGWDGWLDGLPDVIPPWMLDRPVWASRFWTSRWGVPAASRISALSLPSRRRSGLLLG